jgi:hypothetical protein
VGVTTCRIMRAVRLTLLQHAEGLWGLPSLLLGAVSPGIKRSVPEAAHLPSSSNDIKNGFGNTSAPPIRLHGMHRYNFTLRNTVNVIT